MERLKEIGELREQIAACTDETELARLKQTLTERELAFPDPRTQ
jgi:hypothetical protein